MKVADYTDTPDRRLTGGRTVCVLNVSSLMHVREANAAAVNEA
jgi:hypothetical protein